MPPRKELQAKVVSSTSDDNKQHSKKIDLKE